MSALLRVTIAAWLLTLFLGCGVEQRVDRPRWALTDYRLGQMPDSIRRQLACTDREPDELQPWVRECYGAPTIKLGFDSLGRLSYLMEDSTWGDIRDANEVWFRSRQHFVTILGAPDTVTDAFDVSESLMRGIPDSIRQAFNLYGSWLGNKLYAFWSRPDSGDCARLEVMSSPAAGYRSRTFLMIGPCSWLGPSFPSPALVSSPPN